MDIFIITAESVAALLGIGLLGYWIIRRRVIPENIMGFLSPLAIDIALPSVVFVSIVNNFSPAEFPNWWQFPLVWFIFTPFLLLLVLIIRFASKKDTRGEFSIGLFFQNGIFFPIFVIVGIFGADSPYLVHLFLFIIFHPPMVFGTYYLFFGKRSGFVNWQRIVNPILISTVVAITVKLIGVGEYIPHFFISILEMLGSMALPLLMLILGGNIFIDFKARGQIYVWEVIKFVLAKNVLFPLVFLGMLLLIRPSYSISLIIFLQSAVPPITAIPILAERCGGNRNIASQFIVGSFVFSVISIPAMVYLFTMFFPVH